MSDTEKHPPFPATGMSHTPSGATPTCDLHARGVANLFAMLGASTNRTMLTEPAECTNCINEWKTKQRAGT